jgi:2-succinyl-5-enolpyruvyl-6-hydroxy-3-cyclohexene-1-carboxylate synthase
LISSGDLLCSHAGKLGDVDLVVRAGPAPLARPVWEWLQRQTCPIVRFDRQVVRKDFCHQQFLFAGKQQYFSAIQYEQLLHATSAVGASWTNIWKDFEEKSQEFLTTWLNENRDFNEVSAAALICRHPSNQTLQLQTANSLSVRHGNVFFSPQYPCKRVWTSRGVNGIDGTIGTAMGLCQSGGPLRLLCGDLAFIHDIPALPALAASKLPLHLIVLNNGGGRIFDTLRSSPSNNPVQAFLRTPQICDLVGLAQSCAIDSERIHSLEELDKCLAQPLTQPRFTEIMLGDEGPSTQLAALRRAYQATIFP